MKIRALWVGKTKEQFIRQGIEKYLRLLRPLTDMDIVEIKEEKGKPIDMAVQRQGQRILKQTDSFALLDVKGRLLSSEGFASYIRDMGSGAPLDFVLGGAYGVSEEVRARARDIISISPMTLTHEMARLVLLEQIYRAVMINQKRGYHH